jgi:hypothetical protein
LPAKHSLATGFARDWVAAATRSPAVAGAVQDPGTKALASAFTPSTKAIARSSESRPWWLRTRRAIGSTRLRSRSSRDAARSCARRCLCIGGECTGQLLVSLSPGRSLGAGAPRTQSCTSPTVGASRPFVGTINSRQWPSTIAFRRSRSSDSRVATPQRCRSAKERRLTRRLTPWVEGRRRTRYHGRSRGRAGALS